MFFLRIVSLIIGKILWLLQQVVMLIIRFYQLVISPLKKPSCRYYPTCSAYGYEALDRHGLLRGGWLALRRVLRCHPWAEGGVDLVPPLPKE